MSITPQKTSDTMYISPYATFSVRTHKLWVRTLKLKVNVQGGRLNADKVGRRGKILRTSFKFYRWAPKVKLIICVVFFGGAQHLISDFLDL